MIEILDRMCVDIIDKVPIGSVDVSGVDPGDWVTLDADGNVKLNPSIENLSGQVEEGSRLVFAVHDEGDRPDVAAAGYLAVYTGAYRAKTDNFDSANYGDYTVHAKLTVKSGRLEPAGASDPVIGQVTGTPSSAADTLEFRAFA